MVITLAEVKDRLRKSFLGRGHSRRTHQAAQTGYSGLHFPDGKR